MEAAQARGRGDSRGGGGRGRGGGGGRGRGNGGGRGRGGQGGGRGGPQQPSSSSESARPAPHSTPEPSPAPAPAEHKPHVPQAPNPNAWKNLGLVEPLLKAVADAGYATPTDIQLKSVPAGIAGRDVIAAAQTGTGKTAAFLLPVLQSLTSKPRQRKSTVLVITPTRELALQIEDHAKSLSKFLQPAVTCATIFGGVGMGPQEQAFRHGVDILITCPGRLLDHLQNYAHYAHLTNIEFLIIDEADRMLDMGFLPDLRKVFAFLNDKLPRQTFFFSATMPQPIVQLAKSLTRDAHTSNLERIAKPAEGVTQSAWEVRDDVKQMLLLQLVVRNIIEGRAIVFCRTKHRAKKLTKFMTASNIPCAEIHGNRSQVQRNDALDGFKEGKYRLLVATDVLARGIDISELGHVVNFDVPHIPEDYIHRVGRTGRAERVGDAFTFISPEDGQDWRAIERAVNATIPRRVLEHFDYNASAGAPLETPVEERMEQHRTQMKAAREKAAGKRIQQLEGMGYTFTPEEKSRFATVKGLEKLNAMISEGKASGRQPTQQPRGQPSSRGQSQPSSRGQSQPRVQSSPRGQSQPRGQQRPPRGQQSSRGQASQPRPTFGASQVPVGRGETSSRGQ